MYKLVWHGRSIVRLSDGWSIPIDPANMDYQRYLEWLAAGNTPDAAEEVPPPTPDPTRAMADVGVRLIQALMLKGTITAADLGPEAMAIIEAKAAEVESDGM